MHEVECKSFLLSLKNRLTHLSMWEYVYVRFLISTAYVEKPGCL